MPTGFRFMAGFDGKPLSLAGVWISAFFSALPSWAGAEVRDPGCFDCSIPGFRMAVIRQNLPRKRVPSAGAIVEMLTT